MDAYSSSRPWVGRSMSVHPEQALELNEQMRREGITGGEYLVQRRTIRGVTYEPGTFIAESRGAKAAEMKRRHFFDKDAGYGDYAGS